MKTNKAEIGGESWIDKEIEFREAFLKAQTSFGPADKSATNPYFKSKYSTLRDVWEACHQALSDNGFTIHQHFEVLRENNKTILITSLCHIGGWSEKSAIGLPDIQDPQKLGSAITYFRRYSLAAICGIVSEDDDAEGTKVGSQGQGNAGSVKPIMTPASTGSPSPESKEFVNGISKSKNFGKTLEQMGLAAVQNDFNYWNARIMSEGKPATGEVKKFIEAADVWLKYKKAFHLKESGEAFDPYLDAEIPF